MATVDTLVRRVQVAHLPPIDSGHGVARLPVQLMKDLGLTEGDVIHARHLNLSFRQTAQAAPATSPWDQIDLSGTMPDALRRVSEEVERRKITQALQDANGNKAHVADALHITYKVLLQKMKTYGIAE